MSQCKSSLVFLCLLALLLAPALLLADEHEAAPWQCPEGYEGQTLNVFNWSTYIAEDTIPNFEEACGVTVNYDIYESNEAMLAIIRQGNPGYDIIVPTGDTVATMIRDGLLVPLDLEQIPNVANIYAELLNPSYDPENGYSVPYQWGTIGIGYNTEKIPDGLSSWEDVWSYDGPVAWIEDRRSMLGFAHIMLGTDPNSADADEIAAARDYLIERSGNVVAIAADDGQVMLERGDVDITIEYNGDILALADECECDTYAYVLPVEGTGLWVDNLSIPLDAPNVALAHVFINYVLHPQVGADISNYTAYASPNQAAVEGGYIDEEMRTDDSIYPSEETRANLFTIKDSTAEQDELYNNAWDELLIFVGG